MISPLPSSVPDPHRKFLQSALEVLWRDERLLGLAAGGSLLSNAMDEFSDLDLVIATEVVHHSLVLAERPRIAASLGPLLSSFTGEHVGEPRLLICFYGRREIPVGALALTPAYRFSAALFQLGARPGTRRYRAVARSNAVKDLPARAAVL